MISELVAATHYAKHGYEIYWPALTQSVCDFIAVKDSETLRVQVKTAYWFERESSRKYLQATLRKGSGGNKTYTKEHCDVIVIVSGDQLWIIPIEVAQNLKTVVVSRGQEIRRPDPRNFNADLYKVVDKQL